MTGKLLSYYRRQQFNPGFFGLLFNPFFLARRQLWNCMADLAPQLSGRLLDVGCGSKPYRSLFAVQEYIGLDIDSETTRRRAIADVVYDGTKFPFDDGRFTAVLCNQVLEHVFDPDHFVGEIRRVLVPGGKLLLTVPFVWDEHEQPWDYARYSSFGLRALLEKNGLRVTEQKKLLADATVLFQLLNAYIFKITKTRWPIVSVILTPFLMAPISLLGWFLGAISPKNPDFFIDQVIVAEKI